MATYGWFQRNIRISSPILADFGTRILPASVHPDFEAMPVCEFNVHRHQVGKRIEGYPRERMAPLELSVIQCPCVQGESFRCEGFQYGHTQHLGSMVS